MKTRIYIYVFVSLPVFLSACHHPIKASEESIPAKRIAYAGHGLLFDRNMKQIKLDQQVLEEMQDSILAEIAKTKYKKSTETESAIAAAEELLQSKKLTDNEIVLLKSGMVNTLLLDAPAALRDQYLWRSQALFRNYWNVDIGNRKISEEVLERLRKFRLFDPIRGTSTSYMGDCRAHQVPIPPDWAETGTAWVNQSRLETNLLDPGAPAYVWTYSDPDRRGACIALPRDGGEEGTLAGIICQSATTGHACFWDNQKETAPAEVLGWAGKRLVISELVDGSDMGESKNCTGCHRGDNVFLISPDDPTWKKVLRGPLSGPSTGTLTTRVESSSDNQGGHPRYIPITTIPDRLGWQNTFSPPGC